MSFIACPLCGKMTSRKTFDPTSLDLDIYSQTVQGLGRGKGFKVVDRSSALHIPTITEPIKDRLLDILSLFYDEEILSEQELVDKFGLISPENYQLLEDERDSLRADLEETQYQLKEVEGERDAAKAKLEEANETFSDELNELIDLVADALEEDRENWEFDIENEDGAYTTLKYGIERLIDDYEALKAIEEEE